MKLKTRQVLTNLAKREQVLYSECFAPTVSNNTTVGGCNPYGGTDAGAMHVHSTGVPTLVLSTPARYIHSPASLASIEDIEQVKSLLGELLLNIDLVKDRVFGGS